MRGLDGNFLNTQGEAATRLQTVYQAEQNRQQVRAQMEGLDELRKLREQVGRSDKKEESRDASVVGEDSGFGANKDSRRDGTGLERIVVEVSEDGGQAKGPGEVSAHIDIRV